MKVHWTEIAAAMALVAAGCVAIYARVKRGLRHAAAQQDLESLASTVKVLQMRVSDLEQLLATATPRTESRQVAAADEISGEGEQTEPQTLVAITAAATAFLGKMAHVRSARAVATSDAAGAWAQQGRVTVQTSHNLRTRR